MGNSAKHDSLGFARECRHHFSFSQIPLDEENVFRNAHSLVTVHLCDLIWTSLGPRSRKKIWFHLQVMDSICFWNSVSDWDHSTQPLWAVSCKTLHFQEYLNEFVLSLGRMKNSSSHCTECSGAMTPHTRVTVCAAATEPRGFSLLCSKEARPWHVGRADVIRV